MPKHILCYSAGKDSTALLIHILKNKYPLDEILYVDVGEWMWKEAKSIIKQAEKQYNINITILNVSQQIQDGFNRWGFPHFTNRWCTGIKREAMRKYLKEKYPNEHIIQYIGYTADETKRTSKKLYSSYDTEYPLVDDAITSTDAMNICTSEGFNFNGIYKHHSHFNCWCCPLQRVQELEYLYMVYPEYWDKLRTMQNNTEGFYSNGKTIFQYEHKFWKNRYDELHNKRLKEKQKAKK